MTGQLRHGMSLIEVMVAMTVLAVGLMAVVGQIAPLNSQRQFTKDTQLAQTLVKAIGERIATAPFESLRTDTLPWTYVRQLPLSDNSLPPQLTPETSAGTTCQPVRPLDETSAVAGNNLLTQGLATQPTGLMNLQVFIEYYRTISRFQDTSVAPVTYQVDSAGRSLLGLLCEANPSKPASPSDFRTLVNGASTHYNYALLGRPGDTSGSSSETSTLGDDPAGHMHKFDAVLVRIVVTWGDGRLDYDDVAGSLSAWRTNRRVEIWTGIRSSTQE
jgi:prepilin-type N-terminal cleavage/methylation domain-containing protein